MSNFNISSKDLALLGLSIAPPFAAAGLGFSASEGNFFQASLTGAGTMCLYTGVKSTVMLAVYSFIDSFFPGGVDDDSADNDSRELVTAASLAIAISSGAWAASASHEGIDRFIIDNHPDFQFETTLE